jgi:hypothetical protein
MKSMSGVTKFVSNLLALVKKIKHGYKSILSVSITMRMFVQRSFLRTWDIIQYLILVDVRSPNEQLITLMRGVIQTSLTKKKMKANIF